MSRIFYVAIVYLLLQTSTMVNAAQAPQEDRPETIPQMEKYLAKRMPVGTKELVNRVAKKIDVDGDGKISEAEFENRMQVFREVASNSVESARKSKTKSETKATPKSKAEPIVVVEIPALVDSNKATVLLITADELAKAWVPFAKWKTKNGKLTKIVTVGQIDKRFTADSIQEKIRQCVRQHIDNHNTRWLILGGDCLPDGEGLVPGGHTTVHRKERKGIPTDIVYLSPTNWDADEDGVFGEFEDDREAITYPDGSVGIGRIPVRSVDDVKAFTEKVIAYESNYPTDQFAENMVYTCTEKYAYPKVRNSWDDYVSKAWGGKAERFFADETPWDEEDDPGSHELSADNFVKLINDSTAGKLHVHGHGLLPVWVLEKSVFSGKNVKQLSNDGAYPLITTVSCFTGQYDSDKDPSIVEQMLRAPRAGSVAIVAPIRSGKAHFAKRSDIKLMITEGKLDGTTMLLTNYWKFGLGDLQTTGHAFANAKQAMAASAVDAAAYHLCVCELNLLGDPTLDMRANVPRAPTMEVKANKGNGSQWKVAVETDAPGSTICVWDQKDSYHVATADKNGNATLTVTSSEEQLEVSVSGKSLNSVTKTCPLR